MHFEGASSDSMHSCVQQQYMSLSRGPYQLLLIPGYRLPVLIYPFNYCQNSRQCCVKQNSAAEHDKTFIKEFT